MKNSNPSLRHNPDPRRRRRRRPAGGLAGATLVVAIVAFLMVLSPGGFPFGPRTTPTAPPSATPAPTATPAPATPTTAPSATPQPVSPTLSPPPSVSPVPTPDMAALEALPNKVASWSYLRPSPTFEDVRTLIAITRRPLVERYGVLWQAPRSASGKVVYLTFDEGYEYKNNTTLILDVLEAKDVPAAFFVTGTYVRDNPALAKRMADGGFLVGNHTWSHPSLPEKIDALGFAGIEEELASTEDAFLAATGKPLGKYLRPPEGHYSERMLAMTQALGYRTVFWSFAFHDWVTTDQPTRQQAMDTLLGELHDGSVILLHAVSTTNTVNLADMIDAIAARGYTFERLDQAP